MYRQQKAKSPSIPVSVEAAVEEFGVAVAEKLGRGGDQEDQLRGPLETLLKRLGGRLGLKTVAYGEVTLKALRARPDYAVDVGNARVGYIELKAPHRGVPGTHEWKPTKRERRQWEKLCELPNVIYSDGICWGRYKYGVQQDEIVRLDGEIEGLSAQLQVPDEKLELLIADFLCWEPERPRSLSDLIRTMAGLCRLLREEVNVVLSGTPDHVAYEDLTLLAADWRSLLFPGLDDEGFADAYAQTITFALLLARVDGISFEDVPLHEIARQLGKKHSLMGRALAVLTDGDANEELRTIETIRRIVGAVDWNSLDDGKTDVYVELYERFLAEYDPERRKESGSYYTPQRLAKFMVNFVNQILRGRMNCPWGLADDDVVIVDPAMGTGTFLVEAIRSVAETVDESQGKGARPDRLRDLFAKRLIGFEIQVAPYAIAEMRLHQALMSRFETDIPSREVRFLTDALDNPNAQQERLGAPYKIIEKSRDEANRIKREVPVMVVLGNPPHVENTKGKAQWIEDPRDPKLQPVVKSIRPSLDEFRLGGKGRYESDLHGLPWLFWRWAIWKTFEAHPDNPMGVVAFITPASLIEGKAFAGIRQYLRSVCDEGWVINLSPEGDRPEMGTRIFGPKAGRTLCIAIFAKTARGKSDENADVHYLELSGTGDQKLDQLDSTDPDGPDWKDVRKGGRDVYLPSFSEEWDCYPALADLMPWRSRGVTTGRNWIYAPEAQTLRRRWSEFIAADIDKRRQLFNERRDRTLDSIVSPLPGFPAQMKSVADEAGDCLDPVQVAFRPFDRQWVIPDNRLMAVGRPPLWKVRADRQIYVTEQDSHAIDSGPGLLFTGLIPDIHHFNGRDGGTHPLYRDPISLTPNIAPRLLEYLSEMLSDEITADEFVCYMAAVVAHRGYTDEFKVGLRQPGIRLPMTLNPELWADAVEIGRELIWYHTFGERFVDDAHGRPVGARAIAERLGIRCLEPINFIPERLPREGVFNAERKTIEFGGGSISPVTVDVWRYDVGGMPVIRHWLNYRVRYPRYRKVSSALDYINSEHWNSRLTDELLSLVAVLTGCTRLESRQRDLLAHVRAGRTVSVAELEKVGILPIPETSRNPPKVDEYGSGKLSDLDK